LSATEQARLKGFIINKFRGDPSLLGAGIDWLADKTGKTTVGIVPLLTNVFLDAEDSLSRTKSQKTIDCASPHLKVVVADLPTMSNHTDFDPLIANSRVQLRFAKSAYEIIPADLVILPGSKSVLSDLAFLEKNGWREALMSHLRYGGKLIGICGGFQMLGEKILDPLGVESDVCAGEGFHLLPMSTTLDSRKLLLLSDGRLNLPGEPLISGYEIHCGVSSGVALENPAIVLSDRLDGAISADGQILGTYFHGLFEAKDSANALLAWAGLKDSSSIDYRQFREASIDDLADALENHLDMNFIERVIADSHC
jgi:adenosylcobyric acid synthase